MCSAASLYHDRKLATGGTLTTAAPAWPVLGTRRLRLREREGLLSLSKGRT